MSPIEPAKPASRMLFKMAAPSDAGRGLPPINAIERGERTRSSRYVDIRCARGTRWSRYDAAQTVQRPHHILACDDAGQPTAVLDDRHAPDAVIDHQLQHALQSGVRTDRDELPGH